MAVIILLYSIASGLFKSPVSSKGRSEFILQVCLQFVYVHQIPTLSPSHQFHSYSLKETYHLQAAFSKNVLPVFPIKA